MDMSPVHQVWQNHLARHSERADRRKAGRQHQEIDRPGVRQAQEGSEAQRKMEETGCEIICGAPRTLVVEGQMMTMTITSLLGVPFKKSQSPKADEVNTQ